MAGHQEILRVLRADHAPVSRETKMPRTTGTVPPSHHSTSLPPPASSAMERCDVGIFGTSTNPLPPIALKSLLCVRDRQTHEIFLFFSHHSIVILRD